MYFELNFATNIKKYLNKKHRNPQKGFGNKEEKICKMMIRKHNRMLLTLI